MVENCAFVTRITTVLTLKLVRPDISEDERRILQVSCVFDVMLNNLRPTNRRSRLIVAFVLIPYSKSHKIHPCIFGATFPVPYFPSVHFQGLVQT